MPKETYKVFITPSGARDLDDLNDKKRLIKLQKVFSELSLNPRPHGSIKLLDQQGGHRIRLGNYRCCYRIDDPGKMVYIYRIKHRKDVYR